MNRFRALISLTNLVPCGSIANPRGQIATLLLLGIGVVLILTLATANIGRMATTATAHANTADSAALVLATQLGTKSHGLWQSMGQPQKFQKCRKGGMLGMITAIIVAIVLIVVTWGAAAPVGVGLVAWLASSSGALLAMAAGAVGGAIGGVIGGSIAGTGALQGAVQGAAVGAALGAAAGSGASLGASLGASAPATAGELAAMEGVGMMATGATTSSAAGAAVGAGAAATVSAASSIYSGAVREQITSDAIASAVRSLNGLPEQDRFREQTMLSAFAQTVDDPHGTDNPATPEQEACYFPDSTVIAGDPEDANTNGNRSESIPCFEYWWQQRIQTMRNSLPNLKAPVQALLDGPMAEFEALVQSATVASACTGEGSGTPATPDPLVDPIPPPLVPGPVAPEIPPSEEIPPDMPPLPEDPGFYDDAAENT